MSTFGIYLIGYIIFVVGLLVGLNMLGVPPIWLGVVGLIFTGLGIATGVGKTRRRDTNTE